MTNKRAKPVLIVLSVVLLAVLLAYLMVLVKPPAAGRMSAEVVSYSDQDLGFAPSDRPEVLRKPEDLYVVAPEAVTVGSRPYTDREYVLTELPDFLSGLTFLQTCNGHKARRGEGFGVTVSLSRDGVVFLAVDNRAFRRWERTGVAPKWLLGYRLTEHRVTIDDPSSDYEYRVLYKEVEAGELTLGEPGGGAINSMYFAFFARGTASDLGVEGAPLRFEGNEPTGGGPPRRVVSIR